MSDIWVLYHIALPVLFGLDSSFNDELFQDQFCKHTKGILECRKDIVQLMSYYLKVQRKVYPARTPQLMEKFTPETMSSLLNNGLKMEHMSWSGISNARSMTMAMDYMLFNNNNNEDDLDSNNSVKTNVYDMTDRVETKYDLYAGLNTNFTQGGFNRYVFENVEWYGWPGWGGSTVVFAPKYNATFGMTVASFQMTVYLRHEIDSAVIIMSRMLNEMDICDDYIN